MNTILFGGETRQRAPLISVVVPVYKRLAGDIKPS